MSEQTSALYPAASPRAVTWFATLRTTLEHLSGELGESRPIDSGQLARELRATAAEAQEVPEEILRHLLDEFSHTISGLTKAFGLTTTTLLTALGRGQAIGELDPIVAEAAKDVTELKALTASGSVTVEREGRATTLIAAITIAEPTGPTKLTDPHWHRTGRQDVWLCAVPPEPIPAATAAAAFERILPHAGVIRAHLRTADHRALHIGLQAIDPDADEDLVMGRLEGWRAAVEQLHRGLVEIVWEQA